MGCEVAALSTGKVVVTRVEDVRPASFPWGQIRWLFHSHLATDAEMTFGVVTLRQGKSNPGHNHPNCEELLYLLKGRLEHCVGESRTTMSPGTLIRIPRGVEHHAVNVGDGDAVMVVSYSAPVRQTAVEREDDATHGAVDRAAPEPNDARGSGDA